MTFDSLIDFNAFIDTERIAWDADTEAKYIAAYNNIAAIVSGDREMAIVALFAVAQDCIGGCEGAVDS